MAWLSIVHFRRYVNLLEVRPQGSAHCLATRGTEEAAARIGKNRMDVMQMRVVSIVDFGAYPVEWPAFILTSRFQVGVDGIQGLFTFLTQSDIL